MKRSFIYLSILSLVLASCGTSGQYAAATFQDGIYESSVPASDLAILPNAAGTQFNDQLELEYDEYGWSTARTSSSIILLPGWAPWSYYAYSPHSWYWSSLYWDSWCWDPWYWDWYYPYYYHYYPHHYYPHHPYPGQNLAYSGVYTPHAGVSVASSATRRPSSASSNFRRSSTSSASSVSRSSTAVRRGNS